jgi:23S rRNA pseudouridine1911/1915/1917 synthase
MIELRVPAEGAGERLDSYLAKLARFGSRSQVQRLIEAGRVEQNGKTVKAGTVLREGDLLRIAPAMQSESATSGPAPEDIPLDVLYEDGELLVIAKPAGLVVHPAPGHWRGTLVNALLHRWRGARPGLEQLRPGIVHRLDRDTSGVLVIGKTPEVVLNLSSQFRLRSVEKEYLAVVWRCPRLRRGEIDNPIGRDPKRRKRMAIRVGGRAAVTRYEVRENFGDVALLRVFPETGRTHQIRVHLAAAGHPILGDKVYGRARAVRDRMLREFPRHALHAARLECDHPRTGSRLRFEAPLPSDLRELLEHLHQRGRIGAKIL